MIPPHKGTTVDTTNIQPVEIIHMDLDFYNVTSIHGLTSILTVVYGNTIMLWIFITASKQALDRIISFILKTFKN